VHNDEDGVWLAYTFGRTRAFAFPDQMWAISYVSQPEGAGRGWDVAFAPFGQWFEVGAWSPEGESKLHSGCSSSSTGFRWLVVLRRHAPFGFNREPPE
jgi:hypothetical protein